MKMHEVQTEKLCVPIKTLKQGKFVNTHNTIISRMTIKAPVKGNSRFLVFGIYFDAAMTFYLPRKMDQESQ